MYHNDSILSSTTTTTATIIDSNLSCHGNLYWKNVGQYVPMDIEKLFSAIGNYNCFYAIYLQMMKIKYLC